jgi:hypothetical protein
MICNKCKIDKSEEEFLTYYQNIEKKYYTNKVCKTCKAAQSKEWRERIKENMKTQLTNKHIKSDSNPQFYLCSSCNENKSEEDWYIYIDSNSRKRRSAYCKQCAKEKGNRSYSELIESSGGSTFVYSKPNFYADETQKEITFEFLQILGYLYNEELGVWLKPGVKELVNGRVVFLNLTKKKRKNRNDNKRIPMTDEEIKEIHKYYDEGLKVMDICKILNRAQSTIYLIVKKYDPNYG